MSYSLVREIDYKNNKLLIYFDFLNKKISLHDISEKSKLNNNKGIERSVFISNLKNELIIKHQDLYIDIIPNYNCNLKCEYCYSLNYRHNNKTIAKQSIISKFIESYFQEYNFKRIFLGFIGGGEPLLEKAYIIDFIKSLINKFSSKLYLTRFVTNGLLLNKSFLNKLKSIIEDQILFFNITINYLNMNKIDSIIDNLNYFIMKFNSKNIKITFQIYIYKKSKDEFDLLFNKIFNINWNNNVRVVLKPVITEFKNISGEEHFYDICKLFLEKNKNCRFTDFIYPCVNLKSNNYFAIDAGGNIYKCHVHSANADIMKININNNDVNSEYLIKDFHINEICLICRYFPICLGGCYPYGFPSGIKMEDCLFYNHFTKIINLFIEHIVSNRSMNQKL